MEPGLTILVAEPERACAGFGGADDGGGPIGIGPPGGLP